MAYSSKEIKSILDNPAQFISRLKIKDKTGKLVNLYPNEEQVRVIESLEGDKDLIICKPRQIGSTTIIAAYLFWKAYISSEPITVALLSHKIESVRHILRIFKTFYESLPSFLRKPLREDSASKIVFHNGATILCASANSRGGLRSFTCSYLLLSEFAFAEDADELKATAVAAVNSGKMIIESTANYHGDPLHLEIEKAERGEANYDYLFFRWFDHGEYVSPVPKDFQLTEEEEELKEEYNLSAGQIAWRRSMVEKLGLDKFKREYPACLSDAYSQSEQSYFVEEDLRYVTSIRTDGRWQVLAPHDRNDSYSIGVDVGSGTGKDYSVAIVMSKTTAQPVAIFRCNQTTPVELAEELLSISAEYGNAKILVESNNVGIVVLQQLPGGLLWTDSAGKWWTTNLTNKRMMFEELREGIRTGYINNLDNITISELRSIKLDKHNNLVLTRANGSHCDSAVALALALQCLKIVRLPTRPYLPDFIKARKASRIIENATAQKARRY